MGESHCRISNSRLSASKHRFEQSPAIEEKRPIRNRNRRTFNGNRICLPCSPLHRVLGFRSLHEHKQRIARATEKHATLLYKTGKKTIEVTQDLSHKTNVILKDGLETKGIDKEIYMAVISLALQEYLEDVHDVESGIITIKPKQTRWNAPKFNNNNNNVKI